MSECCAVCDLTTDLAEERTLHQQTIKRAEAAEAEIDEVRKKVRELHQAVEPPLGPPGCGCCRLSDGNPEPWPCATIRAMDVALARWRR